MIRIDIEYEDGLRCRARHVPSGETLKTDAPVDNKGRGESFSPTDLVATALGTCVCTIMGIYADRDGFSLKGMSVHVSKHMTQEGPRRIERLELEFRMPAGLEAKRRQALERCVSVCPVRLSLHPEIEVPVTFQYPD
jgi:putative redox protein